jgi:hypothetical protein
MWKNVVERGRTQLAIWRMRVACWVPKATDTFSEYVIIIVSRLEQWVREGAQVLVTRTLIVLFNLITCHD